MKGKEHAWWRWSRVCARCNGIIYKGEGKQRRNVGVEKHTFWYHKDINLCLERQNLRISEQRERLIKAVEAYR